MNDQGRDNAVPWGAITAVAMVLALGGAVGYSQWKNKKDIQKQQEEIRLDALRKLRAQADERSAERAAEEKKAAAKAKVDAEAAELERVLEENMIRVQSGRKDFICLSCLGRGIAKDDTGPRTCWNCNGTGKTR